MRFCDLFISYKIGLKGIKNTIPWTKLPLHRRIAIIITFSLAIANCLFSTLHLNKLTLISLCITLLCIFIFLLIDSRKKNLKLMLNKHYSPYSKERMTMLIHVLENYKINIYDANKIDQLIEEAQRSQIKSDYFLALKTPLKILSTVVFPIVAYTAKKISDSASSNEILTLAIEVIISIILVFSLIWALSTIVKDICLRDYNKYNELIDDLRQLKLFYAKTNKEEIEKSNANQNTPESK